MMKSILMGLAGGQRSFTPLAVVAVAALRGELPRDSGAPRLLGHPLVAGAAVVMAAAEMAGDKLKSAPDRVVPPGLAARIIGSGLAGMALAPRRQRWTVAAAGSAAAVAASYVGWRARLAAMERGGQTATGFAEDAAVLGSAVAVVRV